MILEALARLEMTVQTDFIDMLRGGPALGWGMDCVCFVYEEEERVDRIRETFASRRTPLKIFVCRWRTAAAEREDRFFGRSRPLKEIWIE